MMTRDMWRDALSLACRLGVPPAAFWRLSLREWRALAAPVRGEGALSRADFEALARRYPDR
ncbi:MAG: phage tail assembly chaperone [Caulobacterales bacterium]|nr:phage tail assembly chaperone [Caulobacterales bacterium]